jgi:hypothetical protein
MADVYTGITVFGLYDNNTEAPLFAANGTTVPTSSILMGGSDGTNIQPFSVDNTGKLNVNASITPPSDNVATGSLAAGGATNLFISTEGTSALMVQITTSAGYDGTLLFEVSLDSTTGANGTYVAAKLYPAIPNGDPAVSTITPGANATLRFTLPVGGIRFFRVRDDGTGTTGSATVTETSGQGQYAVFNYSDDYNTFLAKTKITDGTNTAAVTAGSALETDLHSVAGIVLGATGVTAFGTAPAAANVAGTNASIYAGTTGLTATGTSLNTNVTNTVTVTGTVSATQGTTPWSVAPDGTVWALTGTSANVDVTNTVTVTGTVAVTQSTSPWVVAGNLTHNNAAPTSNNVGVLPAVASTAAPTYTTGDQVLLSTDLAGNLRTSATISGTVVVAGNKTNNAAAPTTDNLGTLGFEATNAPLTYTNGNQVLATTSLGGAVRVVPVDEENASSISYYSVDTGNVLKSVTTAVVFPLISIRSSSAAFIFRVREVSGFTDGTGELIQLIKNPQTLTGSTFAATAPSGSHVTVDTAATAVTIGTGVVVWSGYAASIPAMINTLMAALAGGTPGDVYTVACQKFGTGTSKAGGQIHWSEQAAAL